MSRKYSRRKRTRMPNSSKSTVGRLDFVLRAASLQFHRLIVAPFLRHPENVVTGVLLYLFIGRMGRS